MTRQTPLRRLCIATLGAALSLAIGACAIKELPDRDAPRGTRLTVEEVRSTFIGSPWRGSSGTFHFRLDGTYVYTSEKTTTEWGPWRYQVNEDGTITGASATYTFYKIGPGFRYHNSETDEYYLAAPGTSNGTRTGSGRAQLETCLGTQVFCSAE